MTSIRRFVYAAVLAVTTLNFAPSLASAQEPAPTQQAARSASLAFALAARRQAARQPRKAR